jgi:ATP-dependent DNA helicase UvrD/PcrA
MSPEEATPAIRAALHGNEPSDEQWRAITFDPAPLAIIAGAGSGKTAIMAARIAWMVEEGMYRPSQILGLTFTNKAAGELEERILAALAEMDPPPPEAPVVATYNSFADKLIREYGVRVGIDPEVGLLSKAQAWQLLLSEFESIPPFEAIESRAMSTVVATALSLADQCANHLVAPERIAEEDSRIVEEAARFDPDVVRASAQRIEYAGVVRAYLEAKKRARRIDFGDQVLLAVEVLEKFPGVADELRERYPALLLDEYQDTNVAQRRLLQIIAPEGHNVTAVGDARQNIFQWRGSTLFNLIDFPKRHFLRAGGEVHDFLPLSTNYRSGSKILEAANQIIDEVPESRRPGEPLTPHPPNGEGAIAVKVLADQYREAGFIAGEIVRLHGEPPAPGREPSPWSEFAILVRRKAHIPPIYRALKERDVPVEVVGLSGLLQVPEVMDTVAWLRVLADPGPPGNRFLARILMGPRFRIHYRDLALLARWAAQHTLALTQAKREAGQPEPGRVYDETEFEPEDVAFSLAEALDHLDEIEGLGPEALRRLAIARAEIAELRPAASGPLLELVQAVIDETGIWEALECSTRGDAPSGKRNLTNFLGAVANFAPVSGEPSLGAFLAYLDAAEDVEETLDLPTDVAGDSVKLMTVHQAKGLEFETVFIPCVAARVNDQGEYVDSYFPDTRSSNPMTSYGQLPPSVREDAEHLPSPWVADANGVKSPKKKPAFKKELTDRAVEDERRLFYVALTRAKQRLFVTAAWWYERQTKARGPSQFFEEMARIEGVEVLAAEEMPAANPLRDLLAAQAVWPPPPNQIETGDIFPEGYPVALETLISGELSPDDLIGRLPSGAVERARRIIDEHAGAIRALANAGAEPQPSARNGLPRALSATSAVALTSGALKPEQIARPLPERPSPARRIGVEVHRWIEERARGLTGLADEEALDRPGAHVERSRLAELQDSFAKLGYQERPLAHLDTGEPMAELPFVIKIGGRLVRGRIDAVYETQDGGLEVVDFKTGAETDFDQLSFYAAALNQLGIGAGRPLTLTYVYLATGKVSSRTITEQQTAEILGAMTKALA